jgi:hypothetical protein
MDGRTKMDGRNITEFGLPIEFVGFPRTHLYAKSNQRKNYQRGI